MRWRSIIQSDPTSCYWCGRTAGLVRHHAMHGYANRKLAEQDRLYLMLCLSCHSDVHDKGEYGRKVDLSLQRDAERAWLKYYGKTKEDWIRRYGKNVLE